MRKTLTIAMLIFTLLVGGCMALPAQAAGISVEVDGARVVFPDQQPYADANSRVLVPIRFPMEALGVDVNWNQATQQAVLAKGSTTAIFTLGSSNYTVNGVTKTMDTVPIAQNGRTLFPIRFAAEAFGATVSWDQATMTAKIMGGQVDQVPLPEILMWPADKSKLYNSNLIRFGPGSVEFQGVKVQCVNNDMVNQTINGRRDLRYNGYYAVSSHKCYGSDASYQVQPGEVLVFDVWIWYVKDHKSYYGLALDDYTWTVPDYR